MVDMTFCGNCICIDYILCNISIIDWKKFVDDVHTFYEDHGLDLKIKNLSEKMSTCFCLMACQKWLGLTMATLWSVRIYIPFFSATLPVNDLCFLILSWSLEHVSLFLT